LLEEAGYSIEISSKFGSNEDVEVLIRVRGEENEIE